MATYELVKAKAQAAKQAAAKLAVTSTAVKNAALLAMAAALEAQQSEILAANERDMTAAAAKGMKSSMLDRLKLTAERISGMADGLRQVAGLADPVGNVIDGKTLPNGLHITKIRVPLGVIGIIYEARPNVTAEEAGLSLKSSKEVLHMVLAFRAAVRRWCAILLELRFWRRLRRVQAFLLALFSLLIPVTDRLCRI